MQFQHTTPITPAVGSIGGIGGIGVPAFTVFVLTSGGSINILTNSSPTYQTIIQQVFVSWTGVTSAGEIDLKYTSAVGYYPITIYQTVGAGNLVLPLNNLVLSNYGLHISNSSTGGNYSMTILYTPISN